MTPYEDIDAINFSTLKLIARSPAHYKQIVERGRVDNDTLKLGRAIHWAVLQPALFKSEVVVWRGRTRYGGVWDEFKDAAGIKTILTTAEWETAKAIGLAVRADQTVGPYLENGKAERPVTWVARDLKCKGCIDWLGSDYILDLKGVVDASPYGFGRAAARYDWHTQGAMYHDGSGGKRVGLVAVEKSAPWVTQLYWITPAQILRGRERYELWLDRLKECRENNDWPGYGKGEMDLQLPEWAMGGDNLADLGLHEAGESE